MTEEEKLAEEYTKTNAIKGLSYRQITKTYDEISGYPYFLEDKIKQAFLAGLEAGQASTVRTDNTETLENALKRIAELEKESKDLHDNYEQYKAVAEPEIAILKLRNCMNCKYRDARGYSSCKDKGIVLCSHWEMKE